MKKLMCAFVMAGNVVGVSALADDLEFGSHVGCVVANWSSYDAIRISDQRLRQMVQNGEIRASEVEDKEGEVREQVVGELCVKMGYTPEP
ncbi:hypothetical protein [Micavibrio aeruginosavorus]|uniref:Uncharacterized protein n=1 Tax=Micavibrio aeruginosavorus EPB TaxID=349215 RepID=M4VGA2_9BACT|nr:hypothetical protein [Micavibrio aeruginosavorus]AGH98248.1 hypothetical protein A11S_1439 [Micavibrio aeruginosavorus EPB]